jgi:hemoglobin
MREAHAHLDIDDEAFDAVAGHLRAALRANDVDEAHVADIMASVESLRDPVLGR